MNVLRTAAIVSLAASVAACVGHHETAALRMQRPPHEPADLAAYAKPNPDYPSVGGDILKGATPVAAAAYQASGDEGAPPPAAQAPGPTPP
jgi:hypothetical protein